MPSNGDPAEDLTTGLAALARGEPGALARVLPMVYARLREMAEDRMRNERAGHTLDPTALVHEAFLKLRDERIAWQDESHYLAVAARAMRQVLIDHARARGREKRGGSRARVRVDDSIDHAAPDAPAPEIDLMDLDDALARLGSHDEMASRIVEMRFFAGMEVEAIARVLGVTDRTVRRHWVYAKAWLARDLADATDRRRQEPDRD